MQPISSSRPSAASSLQGLLLGRAASADAAATGALHCRRWRVQPVRPLQEHCTGCRRSRYRSTAVPPVAGACYRGMRTPVAAGPRLRPALGPTKSTGTSVPLEHPHRRWCLRTQPLQEHRAAAGGWCLLQGYANPRSNRTAPAPSTCPTKSDRTSVILEHPHRRCCRRPALKLSLSRSAATVGGQCSRGSCWCVPEDPNP